MIFLLDVLLFLTKNQMVGDFGSGCLCVLYCIFLVLVMLIFFFFCVRYGSSS